MVLQNKVATSNATIYAGWKSVGSTNYIRTILVYRQTLPITYSNGWYQTLYDEYYYKYFVSGSNWNIPTTNSGYDVTYNTNINGTGSQVTTGTTVTSNTYFAYAQVNAKQFTITYHSNYGSDETKTQGVVYDTPLNIREGLSRPGYTFLGWGKSSIQTSPTYTAGQSVTNPFGASGGDLYAIWSANSYTVTVDGNGGGVDGWNSKTIRFDANYGTLPTVTKLGFTFTGWKNSESGEMIEATTKMTTAQDHRIVAQWSENTYTINFDNQYEKNLDYTTEYLIDATEHVTKPGYQLLYWTWIDEEGNVKLDEEGNILKFYEGESVTDFLL